MKEHEVCKMNNRIESPTYDEMAEVILEWYNRHPGDGAKWFDKMNAIGVRLKEVSVQEIAWYGEQIAHGPAISFKELKDEAKGNKENPKG